jgi:hypothetical protein
MNPLRWLLGGSATLIVAGWIVFFILANSVFSAIMFVKIYQSIWVYSNPVETRSEHAFVRPGRHVGVPTPLQPILNTPIITKIRLIDF